MQVGGQVLSVPAGVGISKAGAGRNAAFALAANISEWERVDLQGRVYNYEESAPWLD